MEKYVKVHLYGVPMLSKDPDEGCSGLWLLHVLHCHSNATVTHVVATVLHVIATVMLAPDCGQQHKLTGTCSHMHACTPRQTCREAGQTHTDRHRDKTKRNA